MASKLVSVDGVPVKKADKATNHLIRAAVINLFAALSASGVEHANELDGGTRELLRDLRGVIAYGPLMRNVP